MTRDTAYENDKRQDNATFGSDVPEQNELSIVWSEYVDTMHIENISELMEFESLIEIATYKIKECVFETAIAWTDMWRDAYDMVARILSIDMEQLVGSKTTDIKKKISRADIQPMNVEKWREYIVNNSATSIDYHGYRYNPLASRLNTYTRIDWHEGIANDEDLRVVICGFDSVQRGETVFDIPGEYFNTFNAKGFAAARLVAYPHIMRDYVMPMLRDRFNGMLHPGHKIKKKTLKADVRVLEIELAAIQRAKRELHSSDSIMILLEELEALYVAEIKSVKEEIKKIKQEKKQREE